MDSATVSGSNNKKNDALDELFRAIQSKSTNVAGILDQDPDLCNMESDLKNAHGNMSPRDFLRAEMFGYLSTPDIIRYLKNNDVPKVHTSSQRPLHVACLLGNHEAIRTLLTFPETDLNARNGDGETPLGVACRARQLTVTKLLLQESAKSTGQRDAIWLDSPDYSGTRPIRYLTREVDSARRQPDIRELADLLSKEAFQRYRRKEDLDIRSPWLLKRLNVMTDDDGWTPLRFAIDRGDYKVAKLLLKAGKSTQHDRIPINDNLGWDARAFAEERGKGKIVELIDSLCSSKSPPDSLCGWTFSESPNGSTRQLDKNCGVDEVPISQLVDNFGKIKDAAGFSWSHLPANNWRWLQLMLEAGPEHKRDESLLNHIEKKFELARPLARGRDFFMGRNRTPPSEQCPEPGPAKKKGPSGGPSGGPSPPNVPMRLSRRDCARSLMIFLPIIDIDDLEEYGDSLRDTGNSEATNNDCKELLPSRTLDNYYQDDLDSETLGKLNESQVFTRHLETLHSNRKQRRRILVVCQFWLLRTNKRRGKKSEDQNPPLREVIMRLFNNTRDPQVIYHDIVKKAIQYQPWIKIHNKNPTLYQQTTYLEIFSKEVQRISQKTNECYNEFKQTLGTSEKHFDRLSNKATTCLLDIDDVCSEIKIIQRVLNDRKRVWRQYHRKTFRFGPTTDDDHSEDEIGKSDPQKCRWGVRNCRPDVVEASLRDDLLEIENTAGAVRDKVHGLVALLHGQASTENALKASEQARYLLIFTLLTVVFSPLSFVTSLLALQVESFTPPTPWAQREVTVACVVSVIATIILCILHVSWMKWCKDPCERLYEAVKNRLYEAVLKPCWQRLMACAHDFKKRRQGDRGNSGTRYSIASILSDARGKASDDLENATSR